MITYENLAETLSLRVPEFKDRVEQHIREQLGTPLPHVLFEDFTSYFLEHLSLDKKGGPSEVILLKCARLIEDLLESDDVMIQNVVAVSFLEYTFESYKPIYKKAQEYFLPKTKAMLVDLEESHSLSIL